MIAKRIALVVVVLAVIAIVAFKASSRGTTSPTGASTLAATAIAPTVTSRPAVVLVADAREADSDCGCGRIIRRVRAAKAQGIAVEEVGPSDVNAGRRYGVTVVPTVVFLDTDGRVVARREGESTETLAAISADLTRLEGARR
jgi:hypothetical protein